MIYPKSIQSSLTLGASREFVRGQIKDVTFDMSLAFADQLTSHTDGLALDLIVSLHGLSTPDGHPPKVFVLTVTPIF